MLMTIASTLTKTRLLFSGLFLVLLFNIPMYDPDYFWHLKTGEYIVMERGLPAGDIFTSMHLGQPWVVQSWLFEVVLYLAFSWLGTFGVELLTAALAVLTLSILFVLIRRIIRSLSVALVLLLLVSIPFNIGISPRPQMFTYLCFCFFLFVLVSHKYFKAGMSLWLLPIVMVVWVNSHAAYIIGIVLLGLFTVCEWVGYWINLRRDPSRRKALIRLAQVSCVTATASLINPGPLERLIYPIKGIGGWGVEYISEFASPNFHTFSGRIYLFVVLLFLLSYVYSKRKPDLTEAVVPTFFLVLGFLALRHIPLAVLAIAPFFAMAIRRCEVSKLTDRLSGSSFAETYKKLIGSGPELGQKSEVFLNWALLASLGIALSIYAPTYHAKADEQLKKFLPVNAASFVLANGISGNMFNTYHYGGYLIYRFFPERKVLIDGRAEVVGEKFFLDFHHIYTGGDKWRIKLKELSIDYAIVGIDAPIRQLLREDSSFVEVYSDQHHSVMLRNSPKYKTLLGQLQK